MVAVRERGQPLHVDAEQPRERVCFSVTERRKFPGGVLHGAVPLTELYAGEPAAGARLTHGAGRGGEPVAGQGAHQDVDPGGGLGGRRGELRGIPLLELAHAGLGETAHRALAGLLREEAQRLGGQVVVVGLERLVARLAQHEGLGGTASAAMTGRQLAVDDEPGLDEVLEVAADGRRGQAEVLGEGGGGDGSVLADGLQHPVSSARLEDLGGLSDIHNTHVT